MKKLWHEQVDEALIKAKAEEFVQGLLDMGFIPTNLSINWTEKNGGVHYETKTDGKPFERIKH